VPLLPGADADDHGAAADARSHPAALLRPQHRGQEAAAVDRFAQRHRGVQYLNHNKADRTLANWLEALAESNDPRARPVRQLIGEIIARLPDVGYFLCYGPGALSFDLPEGVTFEARP